MREEPAAGIWMDDDMYGGLLITRCIGSSLTRKYVNTFYESSSASAYVSSRSEAHDKTVVNFTETFFYKLNHNIL